MTVEELEGLGLSRMDVEEIRNFLASQGAGVLGLPSPDGPYLLPMSFGFDGEESLYFTYVLGAESRKAALSDAADRARFLVYDATSKFMWESVELTGTLATVPESEWGTIEEALRNAWHPDIFEQADLSEGVGVYEFRITDWNGVRQSGLPPGLEPETE